MTFQTEIDIKPSPRKITHDDDILFLGSCFSDSIGERFLRAGFRADVNPLGTLYNPASILEALRPTNWEEFSKWLHTKASLSPKPIALSHKVIVITFGTAWIWRLKETGMIVANCRKQPDALFTRERLTVSQIVDSWSEWIGSLQNSTLNTQNSTPKIIFTISPIRYRKDGYHESQLSKSILLLAVDELCRRFPDLCTYFPSYEIMMDQLRDYRFYADDMLHPSTVAIDYIWQRFQETWFSPETRALIQQNEKLYKQSLHVPNK